MMQIKLTQPISTELAVQLCFQIRQELDTKWDTASARWCWDCQRATGGDPDKRGFLREPGNRGCMLVNAKFAQVQKSH